jgi:hypothetical protein
VILLAFCARRFSTSSPKMNCSEKHTWQKVYQYSSLTGPRLAGTSAESKREKRIHEDRERRHRVDRQHAAGAPE